MPTHNDLPLRDIHLPEPVSWWPPAPGWWLSAGIVIVLAIVFYLIKKQLDKKRVQQSVLTEFEAIIEQYRKNSNNKQLLQSLSVFMRRACISFYPRSDVASVTGKQWLQYLDKTADSNVFANGAGSILATAPYLPDKHVPDINADEVIAACQHWLQVQINNKRHLETVQP